MSAVTVQIRGKVVNQRVTKTGNGKKIYTALLEIAPTGRERTPNRLKLTTFSSTIHSELTDVRTFDIEATVICQLKGLIQESGRGEKYLLNQLTPTAVKPHINEEDEPTNN